MLIDEHNEYVLQVYDGVFEALSKFFLENELLSLVCLYFREFRLDVAKLTNHSTKNRRIY